jgi:hypothetical protein
MEQIETGTQYVRFPLAPIEESPHRIYQLSKNLSLGLTGTIEDNRALVGAYFGVD